VFNIAGDLDALCCGGNRTDPSQLAPPVNLDRWNKTMKFQIVRILQKYLFNPPIKFLLTMGVGLPGYALLETTGCRTRKARRTPVGDGLVGKQFWIVAEHGKRAGYVRNIVANPQVRVRLREGLRARWHAGTAKVLSEDDPRERQRWLAQQLPISASNAAAVRFFGTDLLTVRIDLDAGSSC
jgi:deazaflavin-dependent oxidoreductase (nitroreductase family)